MNQSTMSYVVPVKNKQSYCYYGTQKEHLKISHVLVNTSRNFVLFLPERQVFIKYNSQSNSCLTYAGFIY